MSAPTVEDLKKAIAELSPREKMSLAEWMNLSVIREELLGAEEQIQRGKGAEYDESSLSDLFAETRASALQLLRGEHAKQH